MTIARDQSVSRGSSLRNEKSPHLLGCSSRRHSPPPPPPVANVSLNVHQSTFMPLSQMRQRTSRRGKAAVIYPFSRILLGHRLMGVVLVEQASVRVAPTFGVSHSRTHVTCMRLLKHVPFTIDTPFCSTTLPGYQSLLPTTFQSPYKAYCPVVPPTAPPEAPFAWTQDQGNNYLSPVLPPDTGSDPTYLPLHRQSAPSSAPSFNSAQYYWDDPPLYEPRECQPQLVSQLPANRRIASGGPFYPYAPPSQQTFSQGDSQTATFLQSLRPPVGPMQNYPSPHSDVSKDETRSSNFSVLPSNEVSPYIMFAASPSVASHPSRVSPGRGSEEPPRNSSGQITCLHPKCARDLPVFGRKCEWT